MYVNNNSQHYSCDGSFYITMSKSKGIMEAMGIVYHSVYSCTPCFRILIGIVSHGETMGQSTWSVKHGTTTMSSEL